MPSIRALRRGSYSTLNDEPPLPSLGNVVNTVGNNTRGPSQRTNLIKLEDGHETPGGPKESIPRRVQSCILRNSVRRPRFLTYHGQARDAETGLHTPFHSPLCPQLKSMQQTSERGKESQTIVHGGLWDAQHLYDIVEHLDVIDPQVGTVSTLVNAANSIVIPPGTPFLDRRPVITLPTGPQNGNEAGSIFEDTLDRHVDDLMRRPSPIRRTLLGMWAFLKTPMGVVIGIYGFLVVFWGAAIVIFLTKIINFHNDDLQGFWVEVSSQVENGLFTATGIGLIPFRVIDTYRVYKIWYYKRKTIRLRGLAGLPQLLDPDDLPDPDYDNDYVHVLSDREQRNLHRQQVKFQYHQTWYRAHGSETHRAFPINFALAICCLNDGNSIFQAFLCGTMWGLNRFQRPAWSTGILIPASFLCGIGAAILIWRGGQRTKRIEEVRQKLHDAITDLQTPALTSFAPLSTETHSGSQSAHYALVEGSEVGINISTDKLNQGDEPVVRKPAPYS